MSLSVIAVVLCFSLDFSFAKFPIHASREAKTPTYRTPGCKLGAEFYPLERTWSPEMEQIEGKLHCVQCVCLPVIKKGVLQQRGRVFCRNIKDECPTLTCGPNAMLLPNQCCKSCPGDEPFTVKNIQSLVNTSPTDTRSMAVWRTGSDEGKDFLALMTPRPQGTKSKRTKSKAVARAQLTLLQGDLHFSIKFDNIKKSKFIKVVDYQNTTLFEHEIDTMEKDMVCAIWRNVPSVYMSFLVTGKLRVTLEARREELSGVIITHRGLKEESFSSLLSPTEPDGGAALAMMTMTDDQKSLMFIVRFADVLHKLSNEFIVKFARKKKVMKEFKFEITSDTLEFVDMWSKLPKSRLKQLVRGRLNLVVEHNKKEIFRGQITVKQTCGVYQAILSGNAKAGKSAAGAGGSAVLKIDTKGRVTYWVHLIGLQSKVTSLALQTAPNKRGKSKKLLKLTHLFKTDGDSFDGWANGTADRLKPKEMHSLIRGKLKVNVQTEYHNSALAGDLVLIPSPNYGVATIGSPLVMTGKSVDPPVATPASGLAWLTLGDDCNLQYQIYLGGLTKSEDGSLMVQFKSPVYRDHILPLNNFKETLSSGLLSDISADLLSAISAGEASLEVTSKSHPKGIMNTKVHIPNTCSHVDRNVLSEQNLEYDNEYLKRERTKCLYEDTVYSDGQSWIPDGHQTCTACSCKTGKILCHVAECPKLDCDNPIPVEGECCPQCTAPSTGTPQCRSPGDNRLHYEGSLWHPYVPPFGYSKCAVCFCKGDSAYDCKKLACPRLDCPDSVAIRRNPGDCCKVCPFFNNTRNDLIDPGARSDLQGDTVIGECRFQGSVFPPGAKWHPYVHPFGTVKCVTCACSDGKASCQRKGCNCKRKEYAKDSCCAQTCSKGKKQKSRKKKSKDSSQR